MWRAAVDAWVDNGEALQQLALNSSLLSTYERLVTCGSEQLRKIHYTNSPTSESSREDAERTQLVVDTAAANKCIVTGTSNTT